jgi:putative transposase
MYFKLMKNKNTPHKELCNDVVLSLSADVVEDMLELNSGPNVDYSDRIIVCHLLNASTSRTSINNISDLCEDAPSEGTVRYRLRNLEVDTFQENLNENLKIHANETIFRDENIFAIDFVNIPFYGTEENPGDTIKTKPRDGTSRFYAYASIYVILNNKRYTLAVKYIKKGDTLKDTVDFLIKEIQTNGFEIKQVYLDKEFYTVEVINYLMFNEIAFIIPCVKRGPSGGIRKLFKGRESYSTEYTMRSKENEATFQVNIVVKYSKNKFKKKGIRYFAYAVYNIDSPVQNTFKEYRKRFGIESSYRLINQTKIHTCTKKPALKLLYIGLSFILVNIWIYIQWTRISIPRRGGRRKLTWTFKTMLKQINRTTEEILGFNNRIILKT